MMKKYIFCTLIASLLAFVGCQNEELVNESANNKGKKVTLTANIQSSTDSRLALTPDTDGSGNPIVKVAWRAFDSNNPETFTVYDYYINENSKQTFRQVSDNAFEGNLPDPTVGSSFNYCAYYNEAVWFNMKETGSFPQDGTLREENFLMYTEFNEDDTSINFEHMMAILKPTFKFGGQSINSTITSIEMSRIQIGETGVTVTVAPTSPATTLVENIYLTIPIINNEFNSFTPENTFTFAVTAGGKDYTGSLTIPQMDDWNPEGKLFTATIGLDVAVTPMGNITADYAVKGDFAMADGTFISKDATLTDEQKANVRGIVFWTEKEDGRATLESDAIMKKDYPNCTHGLIVSLKNFSSSWQAQSDKIADWQNNNSMYNGSDYKSVASGDGYYDPINFILGYQNTEVLKAYNASLSDADTGKKVLPVSSLETFSTDNPAPLNTTGWFIPSLKELTLLCDKDVDNVWTRYTNSGYTYTSNKQAMNSILKDKLGDAYAEILEDIVYWSSLEQKGANFVFEMYFKNGQVWRASKSKEYYVRAVCAF